MQYVQLGRTGLDVSVASLGAGGHSRLGMRNGASEAAAANLARAAIERGVNLIDTAPVYGTETAVGAALVGLRDNVVISTKLRITVPGSSYESMDFIAPAAVKESVEASLNALRTDRIDILHLHGVRPQQYQFCLDHLLPELLRLREAGKIRFLGITEAFGVDTEHTVMQQAVSDGAWDVLMLGCNFVNPSAAELVLPGARANRLGVMCMYAVRGALARAESLRVLIEELIARGEADPADLDPDNPTGFILATGAGSYVEAAYRFCRHTPGIDTVLTGTGSLVHLEENISAIQAEPLPPEVSERLRRIFRGVRTATGDPQT